jgi:ankyrin repeat protein
MLIREYLIEHGAQIEDQCLYEACYHANEPIVRLFLEHGANPNARMSTAKEDNGNTPLHHIFAWCPWRPRKSSLAIIKLLIAYGADIHAQNARGETPLDITRRRGLTGEIVNLLKRNGAL